MFEFLWWAVGILILVLVTLSEMRRLQLSRRFKHIPGVPEVPIIGSFYTLKPNSIQGNLKF